MTDNTSTAPKAPQAPTAPAPDIIEQTLPDEQPGEAAAKTSAETRGEAAPEKAKDPEAKDELKEKPKRKGGFQRRIDELTARAAQAERDRDRLLDVVAGKAAAGDTKPDEPQEPKPEDFADYEDYILAKTEWKVERKLEAKSAEKERTAEDNRRRTAVQAAHQERVTSHKARVKEAAEKYPDYQGVAENPDLAIAAPMAHAIMESEAGPDVAYFLGQHPDEAQRISKLSPVAQIREIGRIEAKIAEPAPKPSTSAPDPVPTIAGKASPQRDPAKMGPAEYKAWRAAGGGK